MLKGVGEMTARGDVRGEGLADSFGFGKSIEGGFTPL